MPRKTAYEVLLRIERDASYSHIVLAEALDGSGLDARDRGLATAIVYGTLTWRRAVDNLLGRHLRHGSVKQLDAQVRTILRMGAFQLRFLDRVPDHASVDASVELAKEVGKARAAGLVNAVLRAVADDRNPWWREADRERKRARWLADKWSLPTWLANRLNQQFGERAEALAEAFTKAPPLYLRRPDSAAELEGVEPVDGVPGAYVGESAADWREGVIDGNWVVQDLGSQLIGHFAGATSEMRALDACAGLGGKTLQLLEAGANVTAIDPASSKIDKLREAAASAGHDVVAEVTMLADFKEDASEQFDLVLVDAPCTGLGILRRHAETRWVRKESDINKLSRVQAGLLDDAADLVEPGGLLVYSVCTFTREETTRQVERFLERHDDFERDDPPESDVDWSRWTTDGRLMVLPDEHDTDGFFAVRMRKRSI